MIDLQLLGLGLNFVGAIMLAIRGFPQPLYWLEEGYILTIDAETEEGKRDHQKRLKRFATHRRWAYAGLWIMVAGFLGQFLGMLLAG